MTQEHSARRILLFLAVAIFAISLVPKAALASDDQEPYAIGLWGDLPYNSAQATVGVPNLIADMNSQNLAFTAHDGDLKSGSSECTDAVYTQALGYFGSLELPPPSRRATMTGPTATALRDTLRWRSSTRNGHLFFSTSFTLGQRKLRQQVQSTPLCLGVSGNVPCVENRRWTYGGVTYATLNIQGSCNNLCDTAPDPNEYAARNAADIAWMLDTFAEAAKRHSAAIMFIAQADPGFDATDATRGPVRDPLTLVETDGLPTAFSPFWLPCAIKSSRFKKPVVYVHGDSHYFRVDKPFLDSTGRRLENFTRVETFGDHQENGTNDVNWLKVFVNPRSREVFSYQQQIVPGNRVAVPAP